MNAFSQAEQGYANAIIYVIYVDVSSCSAVGGRHILTEYTAGIIKVEDRLKGEA